MPASQTHIVIMPSYNTGPRLREVVEEVLRNWQPVLVVIDGSTDGSGRPVIELANDILAWDPPVIPGGTISEILWGRRYQIPMLAEGGIAGVAGDAALAAVGEAGPEAILPLKADVIERVLTPLLPKIELPGLGEAVGWLQRIHERLSGVLRVQEVSGRTGGNGSGGEDDSLASAPGLSGIVR